MKINMLKVMNFEAMIYLPKWNEDGSLSTIVIRTDGLQEEAIFPTVLMDAALRFYGSSLQGAKDGTRSILGEISMQPVVVSDKFGLYWFPSTSPANLDCVWFALHHVDHYRAIDEKRISVVMMNGTEITVETSLYSFDRKVKRASHLRCQLEGRQAYQVKERQVSYYIIKKLEDRNYDIDEFYE
ncbi:competence protein ComK [Sporosarcina cyprini]|uniref:competence protein ComK n=1 Tax=Sporosarcina cyprini TaxID=2910523 RepID=UPI001EE097F2|nr:competence protein ComK [Sporosarcina cyprini]MCG3088253.1 competence protein ComK [Sporosarcina cyprini]